MNHLSTFKYILFVVSLVFSSIILAQDTYVYGDTQTNISGQQNKGFSWDKVTLGGNIGATFGDITYFEIAPIAGYYFTNNIIGGVGVNYIYYNDKIYNFKTSIYGGRVFGQYLVDFAPLIAHVEAELINIEKFNRERLNIYNFYVGGGLRQSLGGNSYLFLMVLWNLNETQESFFLQPNPIYRFGIAVGL
ncbi:MAG: hypothetical protein RQ875_10910 [Vicingaceae bacterium]|nr:hypothetical protein [Vicingaceae bacterium]